MWAIQKMISNILVVGIALLGVQHVRAQEGDVMSTVARTASAPEVTEAASALTFLTSMDMESYRTAVSIRHAEESSSLASVSSKLGSFYEEFVFMPGILQEGDWVSAFASGGTKNETTTWHGYPAARYTDPAKRFVYANMTIGPTTYIQTVSMRYASIASILGSEKTWLTLIRDWTLSHMQWEAEPTTLLGYEITTRCQHTSTLPKISLPESVWQAETIMFEPLNSDHFYTWSAVCSYEGTSSRRGGFDSIQETSTFDNEQYMSDAWKWVTIVGESPSPTTATATLTSALPGSGSGTEGVQATSTQAAGVSEVTAWVNAVVVIAAAAAMAV